MNKCLVVLGMHRSGTSALTGTLKRCGVYLGSAYLLDLYEHEFSVNFNSRLLEALGSGWDDVFMLPDGWWHGPVAAQHRQRLVGALAPEFKHHPIWGVKDPRLCITLPLWLEAFANLGVEPYFIIALRPPAEICKSHERRDGFSPQKTMLIWMNYLLTAERYTRHFARCFMLYGDLLKNPEAYLQSVQQKLDLRLPRSWAEAEKDVMGFIDPGLNHHHAAPLTMPETIPANVTDLWKLLQQLCHAPSGAEKILRSIDEIDAEYRRMHSFFLNSQFETDLKSTREQHVKAMHFLRNIGQDLAEQDRLGDAEKYYRQMIRNFPGDMRMHNNLGVIYERKGDLQTAAECFHKALEIQPLYKVARENLERLTSN